MPSSSESTFDASWLRSFRQRLRAWYDRAARDLPWRRSHDPYAVWLSEIMLQQTQVATVKPYFTRFLTALPSVEALAAAEEHDVLRLWEGLGYYRRARQMHQAAQLIVARHAGRVPDDGAALRNLPGIGRYTAGAILSIAFDQRSPILEANTLRLFSRLLAFRGDPMSAAGQQLLWRAAEAVLPTRQVGRFNQALMELGSEVCRLHTPACEECPVAMLCRAQAEGLQEVIPQKKQKPPPEAVREAALIVRRQGRVLVLQWPTGQRWAGLWDFPRLRLEGTTPAEVQRELIAGVRRLTGVTICPGPQVQTLRHGVTRFQITLACHEAAYVSRARGGGPFLPTRWLLPGELAQYPLNSTGRKLAALAGG